jgi:hypothetical protein
MTAHAPRADTDAVGATACEPAQMTSDYRLTAPRRLLNLLMRALLRLGIAPPHNYLLTTRGRRTGVQRIVVRLGGCFRRPPDALVAIISTSPPAALRHDRTRAAGGYRRGRRYRM